MSGSGGGGNDNFPSINRPSQNDSCEGLVINTNLATPNADVIRNLSIGDVLSISALTDQGPIQALDTNGDLAGNIVSREQIRLLSCLIKGVPFIAVVIDIDNGQCQIRIYSE